MSGKGNFMWAVDMMKQGKKVRRSSWGTRINYIQGSIIKSNYSEDNILYYPDFEAIDWEVVEEPKKTLSDKSYKLADRGDIFGLEEEGNLFCRNDVKEALKEFISSLRQLEDSYVNRKAKEIFGEELLK